MIEKIRIPTQPEFKEVTEFEEDLKLLLEETKIGRTFLATKSLKLEDFTKMVRFYEKYMTFSEHYLEPLPKCERFDPGFKRIITHLPNGNEITYRASNGGAELNEWIDTRQINTDIPDSQHGFEQGWAERHNEHLDFQGVNDRDFRQRCIQRDGSNHVLYLKSAVDFQLPQHLRPEWIAEKTGCQIDEIERPDYLSFEEINFEYGKVRSTQIENIDLAIKISELLVSLKFGKTEAIRLILQKDVCFMKPTIQTMVEYLEELEIECDDVTIEWENCMVTNDVENEYLKSHSVRRPTCPDWFQDEVSDDNPDDWTDEELQSLYPNDELDNKLNNQFGSYRLYHGDEAVSHEFITMLRFANQEKLQSTIDKLPRWINGIRENGFWDYNYWGDMYFKRYELHYLTDSQISQIWVYIKARRETLKHLKKKSLSNDAKSVLSYMRQIDSKKIAAALIYSWRDGKQFALYGVPINFNGTPDPLELAIVWDKWHTMK